VSASIGDPAELAAAAEKFRSASAIDGELSTSGARAYGILAQVSVAVAAMAASVSRAEFQKAIPRNLVWAAVVEAEATAML
jgi:hypothetical protein